MDKNGDELKEILCNIDGIPKTTAKYHITEGEDGFRHAGSEVIHFHVWEMRNDYKDIPS